MRSHGEKKSPSSAPTPRSTTSRASLLCRCRFLGLPMDCPSGSCSPRDSEKTRRSSDWPGNLKRHSLGRGEGLRFDEGTQSGTSQIPVRRNGGAQPMRPTLAAGAVGLLLSSLWLVLSRFGGCASIQDHEKSWRTRSSTVEKSDECRFAASYDQVR